MRSDIAERGEKQRRRSFTNGQPQERPPKLLTLKMLGRQPCDGFGRRRGTGTGHSSLQVACVDRSVMPASDPTGFAR